MKPNLKVVAAAALCVAISPAWTLAQEPNPPAPEKPPRPPGAAPHERHHESDPAAHDAEKHAEPTAPDAIYPRRRPLQGQRRSFPQLEEARRQAFLGVVTHPVPPALSAQLGLAQGFGLLVEDVLPESPAAKAGLQKHDILKLMDDQQLVSPDQLARLVEAAGKDAEVTLTVIRKGQEEKITARIAEEPPRPRGPLGRGGRGFFPQLDDRSIDEGIQRLKESVREQQEKIQELQERTREEMERAIKGARRFAAEILPEDVLRETTPGGGPKVRVLSESSSSSWDTEKARVMLKDNDGEIEVNLENGKRTMIAKDPKGTVVFEGPIDTEEQRKAIPEPYRKKLDQVKVGEGRAESRSGTAPAPEKPAGDRVDH